MAELVVGGCKCGLVRFKGTLLNAPMFRCHCRDCQRLTGAGHSEMMQLARAGFTISQACKFFEMVGGSGQPTYSGFCPECGAPLLRRSARMSDRVYVHASSLDDPGKYFPAKSIHAQAAQPWDTSAIIDEN